MNTLLKSSVSLAVLAIFCAPALAADLGGSSKDSPSHYARESIAVYHGGPYIGVHGGWADWGLERPDDNHLAPEKRSPTQEFEGGFAGVQAGYDIHLPGGSPIVIGAVADFSIGEFDGDTYKDGTYITLDSQIDAFGTVRARIGYTVARVMPYVTGGVAWAAGSTSEHCPKGASIYSHCGKVGAYDETDDFTRWGFAYGAGVEAKVTNNITAFAEYLRLDFGTEIHDLGPKSSDRAVDIDVDVIKAGLNYRF